MTPTLLADRVLAEDIRAIRAIVVDGTIERAAGEAIGGWGSIASLRSD